MSFFIGSVYAQAAGAAPANPQSALMSFVPFIFIFFIFYFLMIRPQKKRMEEEKNFLGNLKKGDEVYTKSGMIGNIQGLTDKIVTLDLGEGVKIKILKGQIGGPTSNIFNDKKNTNSKK